MTGAHDVGGGSYCQDTHHEVKEFLEQCHLPQYFDTFICEGFESLASVYEVTEDDMIAMNVKRGHRRVIQREIATARGIPRTQPLVINSMQKTSPMFYPAHTGSIGQADAGKRMVSSGYGSMSSSSGSGSDAGPVLMGVSSAREHLPPIYTHRQHHLHHADLLDCSDNKSKPPHKEGSSSSHPTHLEGGGSPSGRSGDAASNFSSNDGDESGGPGSPSLVQPKRKYRRHPKPDKNAPIKPPSAYIMFSNHARAQMKDQNMTFAEMAKAVGDQWKSLSHSQKQMYERTAMQAKDEYLVALEQYRQTPEYKKYQEYLKEFKSKQEATNRLIAKVRRRSRKVESPSSGSMADCSSNSVGACNGSNGNGSSSGSGDGDLDNNGAQHAIPNPPLRVTTAGTSSRPNTSILQQQIFLTPSSSLANPDDEPSPESVASPSRLDDDGQRHYSKYALRPRRGEETDDKSDGSTKSSPSQKSSRKQSQRQGQGAKNKSRSFSTHQSSSSSGRPRSATTGHATASETMALPYIISMVVSSDSDTPDKSPPSQEDPGH